MPCNELKNLAERIRRNNRLVEAVRAYGGISLEDVVDGVRTVPEGWVLDHMSHHYIPPDLNLSALNLEIQ